MFNPTGSQTILSALVLNQAKQTLPHHEFVTVTDPRKFNDGKIQCAIRQHVMKGVGQARRTRPTTMSYTFNIVPDQAQDDSNSHHDGAMPGLNPWLKQSKIDIEYANPVMQITQFLYPRFDLPVGETPRIRELVNFVFRDALMNYRPTWQCWLNVAVTDPCPFYMTLSNAALNYAQARGGDSYGHLVDNFEALEFYNLSLRSVQKRIHDPMDEGVLGGVLGFACRDVSTCNFARSTMHLRGLDRIIRLRGGIGTVECTSFRKSLLNIDICGALGQDISPIYPLPFDLFREFTNSYDLEANPNLNAVIKHWKAAFPNCADLSVALSWTAHFTGFVNQRESNPRFWSDDEASYIMYFVLHFALSLERRDVAQSHNPEHVMMEAIRLTLIVFQGNYKARLGVTRGGEVHSYRTRVKALIMQYRIEWSPFVNLQLWVLVVCAVGLNNDSAERGWFVDEIVSVMVHMRMVAWNSAMVVVRGLIWTDEVAVREVQSLGIDVDRRFKMTYVAPGLTYS